MAQIIRLGDRFGRFTVISGGTRRYCWICRCDCGTQREITGSNLRAVKSTSCGCLRRERNNHTTHGATGTLTHKRWRAMRSRCLNPSASNYANYGGRGITICDRWSDFESFLADMGECPGPEMTIERLHNSRGYEPGNCIWATKLTQARNTSANRLLTHGGEALCVAEWAEKLSINPRTIISRLEKGWSDERALTTPVRAHKDYKPRMKA